MVIGCLGVERRVERFFVLSHLERGTTYYKAVVSVYYCRTYYKAVRGGGRRRVDDMCYDRRRAEACVDESAHHALANAGGREIVGKKEGEQKGSARGSVHWGCYYATALDIEVDPQRCGLGSCQSDFALQAVVECRALEPECFRVDILR